VVFGAFENFPDFFDDLPEEFEVALVFGYGKLPVPLVNVGTVVVVEEVVFADGSHIGEETFADIHSELF